MSLQTALAFTLKEEGGFVDHPNDPGGATCQGVTQVVYDKYRLSVHEMNQSVEYISPGEVHDIYFGEYWMPSHCDELSEKLGIAHFDWSVNHGVSQALITLQGVLGVSQDGIFGPDTLTAIDAMEENTLISSYLNARRTWYRNRVVAYRSQADFLTGWLNRVDNLQTYLNQLGA